VGQNGLAIAFALRRERIGGGFCQSSRQRRLNEQFAEQSSDHAVTINRAELGARE
jgi:hypothetical protein